MQCEAFEYRLQWLLDRRDRPDEDGEILEHASCCACCGQLLDAQKRLFQSLAADCPDLDDDFASRVVKTLAIENAQRPRSWRVLHGVVASVAAALLLATFPFWPLGDNPTPGSPVAQMTTEPVREGSPQSGDPDPEAADIAPLLQQWVQQLSNPPLEKLESVDQLSGGIRSLTSTINIAIDALRRNMPVHETMLEDPQADTTHHLWFTGWS